MKHHFSPALFFAVLSLVVLAGLAVYLMICYPLPSDRNSASEQSTESFFHLEPIPLDKEAALSSAQETISNKAETPVIHPLIWVGDSRTAGMKKAMSDDCIYIAEPGEGYPWFHETGEARLRAALKDHPDLPVIFNLGVNDYEDLSCYLTCYQALLAEYPDTRFYFLSVNPIDPEVCTNITNEQICEFNEALQSAFPSSYLDSYTYFIEEKIRPFDGIHYEKEDYRRLHDFVVSALSS